MIQHLLKFELVDCQNLEKLQDNWLVAQDLVDSNQWNWSLWSQNQYIETKYQFGDYVIWFPRAIKTHNFKFLRRWFGPYRIHYYSPNNIILLVTIDKFDPIPTLVNNNKLKPYRVVEDHTLQPILAKPSYFLLEEPIETTHFGNLFIE